MARPFNPVPTYRFHKKTGRAIVTVRNHLGARQDMLLPGVFDSPESCQEFERIKALVRAHGGQMSAPAVAADLSIAELILRFMRKHVETYYVDRAGKPTTERPCITHALRPVNRLFGSLRGGEFDSLNLGQVRRAMITGVWMNDEERAAREKSGRPSSRRPCPVCRPTSPIWFACNS